MVNQLKRISWFSIVILSLGSSYTLAQTANFGTLTLSADKPSGVLTGSTGGSTSLPAIVRNSDRNNNRCLGFGDPTPDHILILKEDFAKLKLQVDSRGGDTTLVVQGPSEGVVRCGDDSSTSKDASIVDTDWKAGTYKIWVGSATPGMRRDYSLAIRRLTGK